MNPVEAMLLLTRAKKRKEEFIPVPYEHVKNSGLEFFDLVRDQNGQIITCKVNKKEYIRWIETSNGLFPKRTDLLNVLRSSLRK